MNSRPEISFRIVKQPGRLLTTAAWLIDLLPPIIAAILAIQLSIYGPVLVGIEGDIAGCLPSRWILDPASSIPVGVDYIVKDVRAAGFAERDICYDHHLGGFRACRTQRRSRYSRRCAENRTPMHRLPAIPDAAAQVLGVEPEISVCPSGGSPYHAGLGGERDRGRVISATT